MRWEAYKSVEVNDQIAWDRFSSSMLTGSQVAKPRESNYIVGLYCDWPILISCTGKFNTRSYYIGIYFAVLLALALHSRVMIIAALNLIHMLYAARQIFSIDLKPESSPWQEDKEIVASRGCCKVWGRITKCEWTHGRTAMEMILTISFIFFSHVRSHWLQNCIAFEGAFKVGDWIKFTELIS